MKAASVAKNNPSRALGLLAGAQIAIGAAAIFARFALTAAGPLSVSALRLGIAAVPVVVLAALRGRYARFDGATERRLQFAGLALAVHFGTWIASLQHASAAVSTLLVCSTPVFTEAWSFARVPGGRGHSSWPASRWRLRGSQSWLGCPAGLRPRSASRWLCAAPRRWPST
jgi:drug/metabolite transporter (DMT)-like permease